jgi:uncharacterized protein (DUF4213/DUF364 family)
MTQEELYTTLKEKFREIVTEHGLLEKEIKVSCRALTPQEAIGDTERKDYPILDGEEVMMQAEFEGGIGQAFTSTPASYAGTLEEILEMDIVNNGYDRGLFIATLNAVMRKLGLCDRSIHCKNEGPEECGRKALEKLQETYGNVKITQIGYQPALLEHLLQKYEVKVLDLNPKNVGQIRYGVKVLDGDLDYEEAIEWADIVLCTGSTLGNGSIVNFMGLDKEVLFYGTTAAGAAELLGLKRLCYAD